MNWGCCRCNGVVAIDGGVTWILSSVSHLICQSTFSWKATLIWVGMVCFLPLWHCNCMQQFYLEGENIDIVWWGRTFYAMKCGSACVKAIQMVFYHSGLNFPSTFSIFLLFLGHSGRYSDFQPKGLLSGLPPRIDPWLFVPQRWIGLSTKNSKKCIYLKKNENCGKC